MVKINQVINRLDVVDVVVVSVFVFVVVVVVVIVIDFSNDDFRQILYQKF